jgi:hypothetical protein
VVTCDGSASLRAVSYRFVFFDGAVVSGSSSQAQHTYSDPSDATGQVTLTVTDSLGRTSTDTWSPP